MLGNVLMKQNEMPSQLLSLEVGFLASKKVLYQGYVGFDTEYI
jgi:hypothetical protein